MFVRMQKADTISALRCIAADDNVEDSMSSPYAISCIWYCFPFSPYRRDGWFSESLCSIMSSMSRKQAHIVELVTSPCPVPLSAWKVGVVCRELTELVPSTRYVEGIDDGDIVL